MIRRLILLTATVGCAVLALGAMPGLTAADGTVVATVSVPHPPAPCLTLSGNTTAFGSLALSDPAAALTPYHDSTPAIRVTSCSAANETVLGAASDATVPSGGSWDVPDIGNNNTCEHGLNRYEPFWVHPDAGGRLYNPRPDGSFIPNAAMTLTPAEGADVTYQIRMPCRGSAGAGETVSITFSLLAVLA